MEPIDVHILGDDERPPLFDDSEDDLFAEPAGDEAFDYEPESFLD